MENKEVRRLPPLLAILPTTDGYILMCDGENIHVPTLRALVFKTETADGVLVTTDPNKRLFLGYKKRTTPSGRHSEPIHLPTYRVTGPREAIIKLLKGIEGSIVIE